MTIDVVMRVLLKACTAKPEEERQREMEKAFLLLRLFLFILSWKTTALHPSQHLARGETENLTSAQAPPALCDHHHCVLIRSHS